MSIAENIAAIRARIAAAAESCGRDPKEILLVGASKMNDAAACREAIAAGIDALGENRVQEMTAKLAEDEESAVRERMRALMERRRASQPLELPSAGSTFKRPAGGYAAALIDQAGLRGCAVGGAQVSEKHAGFVVNRGGATFEDVLRLMEHIQETVLRTSGIALEPEVKIIRG